MLSPSERVFSCILALSLLSSIGAGQASLHTLAGEAPQDRFGRSLAPAGDVNGDGKPDLIVGAPGRNAYGFTDNGTAFVYSGTTGQLIVLNDGGADGARFGWAVSGVGDLDGDGRADLLAGAPGDSVGSVPLGSARVFSGKTGLPMFTLQAESPGAEFGAAVAGLGDSNGDGVPDFAIGAYKEDHGGQDSGSVYAISGKDGSLLWRADGAAVGDWLGFAVAGPGDVDGDGFADVLAGAPRDDGASSFSGAARVYSGRDGSVLHLFTGAGLDDSLGHSVAGAGDLDLDGFPDLILGLPAADSATQKDVGAVQVRSGRDGSLLHQFLGTATKEHLGYAVAGAGDFDGDGVPDVLAGTQLTQPGFVPSGAARIFSGASGALLLSLTSAGQEDAFAWSLAGVGDLNGDGRDEFAIGAFDVGFGPGRASVHLASCPEVESYCFAGANSTGIGARIGHQGGPSVAISNLVLTARNVPSLAHGIFFYGPSKLLVPFGDGYRCVGGGILRLPPVTASPQGNVAQKLQIGGVLVPGSTWNFQFWYRDSKGPLQSGFNLSDALTATFCP
jgi:hypothetical protein